MPPPLRGVLQTDLTRHARGACGTKPRCDTCCLRDLCQHAGGKAKSRPTAVDLCSGAGGFSWGFMQTGFDVLLGVDTCRHARQTFAENIPDAGSIELDVTHKGAADTVIGHLGDRRPSVGIAGPPCQGFSRAGPRNLDDPRNGVLGGAVRLAVKLHPEVIVVENVLNLRGRSSRST